MDFYRLFDNSGKISTIYLAYYAFLENFKYYKIFVIFYPTFPLPLV